jgi:hypothetical protein
MPATKCIRNLFGSFEDEICGQTDRQARIPERVFTLCCLCNDGATSIKGSFHVKSVHKGTKFNPILSDFNEI